MLKEYLKNIERRELSFDALFFYITVLKNLTLNLLKDWHAI